jgi:ABC-type Fe3+/spermidine/putrescine transport system ATPase subunit
LREIAEDAAQPLLEIDRITKRFGAMCAVDEVSIAIRRGEFLTFLGPSGCGKTTLLRIIAGFEAQSSGDIRIGGRSMQGVRPYNRPIGIVFQNLALFPHMSVSENIAFGLKARRIGPDRIGSEVAEVLSLVELGGLGARRIHELSGGQKQRVALARALVLRPEVLLLDEPLGALDLKLRRQLQYELKGIQQRVGTTFLFVTHDQEEALTMSDRIAVINRGRVEQLDSPETIYRCPASPFVAKFIGDTNLLEGVVQASGPDWACLELSHFGTSVHVPCGRRLPLGSRAALSVRPEHVRLGVQPDDATPSGQATVEDRSYVGANTRYALAAAGLSIIALESNAGDLQRTLRIGDVVPFRFDLAHAALVAEVQAPNQPRHHPADEHRIAVEDAQTGRPGSVTY